MIYYGNSLNWTTIAQVEATSGLPRSLRQFIAARLKKVLIEAHLCGSSASATLHVYDPRGFALGADGACDGGDWAAASEGGVWRIVGITQQAFYECSPLKAVAFPVNDLELLWAHRHGRGPVQCLIGTGPGTHPVTYQP